MPALWYSDGQSVNTKNLRGRLPPEHLSDDEVRRFYEEKLRSYGSPLTVENIVLFTGFSKTAVNNWLCDGKLKYLDCLAGNRIPKEYFIDFLCSSGSTGIKANPTEQRNT